MVMIIVLLMVILCVQDTFMQYLAVKELKRQRWLYHRGYNTWFHHQGEPKVVTKDYEQGSYMYFDYHLQESSAQQAAEVKGWCPRVEHDFVFEYQYMEDGIEFGSDQGGVRSTIRVKSQRTCG
ncbi:hypothetical protein CBR_g48492 [Chara braunii]|uniref:NOT2/NOT3/NOT5 C-terminal domain-containing protein n=1 Tax=Chara braunii TaxID=69332 RepID=A0A388M2S5_CHABU|nr:hypothetical protein CBR_g48492 [Chara braunii]|eukprot:GBG88880.1 hypothetical protein CBR_g48492 [Chara braunii]